MKSNFWSWLLLLLKSKKLSQIDPTTIGVVIVFFTIVLAAIIIGLIQTNQLIPFIEYIRGLINVH
jgi:hypothetical protein